MTNSEVPRTRVSEAHGSARSSSASRGPSTLSIAVGTLLLAPALLLIAFVTVAVAGPAIMIAVTRAILVGVALLLVGLSIVIQLRQLIGDRAGRRAAATWILLGLSVVVGAIPLHLLVTARPTPLLVIVLVVTVTWLVVGTVVGVIRRGPRALLPTAVGFALFLVAIVVIAIAAITEGADGASFVAMTASILAIVASLLLALWSPPARNDRVTATDSEPSLARHP